jgi:hypothetical protein
MAGSMHIGFRLLADEHAHAKAVTARVRWLARLRPFDAPLPVLDARGAMSTSPWPSRSKRRPGTMF